MNRRVKTIAKHGGKDCEGDATKVGSCNLLPSPEPPECIKYRNYKSLSIASAMAGYDNFIGNPFDTIVDPGAKSTIFLPDCDGGYLDFISTAYKDINCHSDFSMRSFTDMDSYDTERTQSVEASLSGSVSLAASSWGASLKASASYSRATNSDERAAYKVLTQKKGEIVLAEATC